MICSLFLSFAILIMMYLGVGLFGVILFMTPCSPWTCVSFRDVFRYYFFKWFLDCLLALFYFWYSYDINVELLHVVSNVLKLSSFLKVIVIFCPSDWVFFLPSISLIQCFASSNLLFISSSVLFISDFVLFISDFLKWFLFSFSCRSSLSSL